MTSSARKAWNEAMKATAGEAALPPSLQVSPQKRRSDRHRGKSERRAKAAKVFERENDEFRTWVWIDALEGVDPSINATADDDDEFGDITESPEDKKKKRTKTRVSKPKSGLMPKYLMPRSLGTILLEELSREDSSTYAFLAAEAHVSHPPRIATRKFCPVTGLLAPYTHPKSGIPYSSMMALDQILERPPPWMTLTGSATYLEALKSIQQE